MMKLVVLSCFLAAVSASGYLTPLAPWAYTTPLIQPYNYRGPLSLAPGQPADILGSDGRPLDTLEVNLDRAAHFNAKALSGELHLLKKRSVPLIATPFAAPITPYAAGFPFGYSAFNFQPFNYRGPLSLAPGQPANILGADGRPLDTLEVNQDRAAHLAAKTGLHILKKRSAALIAPFSNIALTRSAIIPSAYSYSAPLVTAPLSPLSYSAYSPLAYTAGPLAYSAPFTTFLKK